MSEPDRAARLGTQRLGTPRLHLRRTGSTNADAARLAIAGAPHGTLVTATEQTSGRGRQGRTWTAPPGQALLCSLLLREPPRLLSLAAGVAVAEVCEAHGPSALLKWPNDVLIEGRKVCGILVEGRPQEGWAVLGIGLNVAICPEQFPEELRDTAGSLSLNPGEVEDVLQLLLERLPRWLQAGDADVLEAFRQRDALHGRHVSWSGGRGTAAGVDADGRLLVRADGSGEETVHLGSGEVHLEVG